MKIYVSKEAYDILREVREELARRSGLDTQDISFSKVIKYIYKKSRTGPNGVY